MANFKVSPFGGMGYWEFTGQVAGSWLGATVWLATSPVIIADGPQPGPVDVAWYYANLRNTNRLRKEGGMLGAQLDDYLEVPLPPGESWGDGYVAPESNRKDTPYVFNKLPEGSGIHMNFKFSFDNWAMPPIDKETFSVTGTISEPTPMQLTYVERDSRWPDWN